MKFPSLKGKNDIKESIGKQFIAYNKYTIQKHCLDKEVVRKAIDNMDFFVSSGCFTVSEEKTKEELKKNLGL